MGLQRLLEDILPFADIVCFRSFEELVVSNPERFVHYFVASGIYFEHAQYFIDKPQRSIVLVHGSSYPRLANLLTLNVCQDEKSLVKSLLQLQQRGHSHDKPYTSHAETVLSPREVEVAILLAKGFINKEVADKLNISITTAISHRKSIMEKLHARSLADIIIHVVMNGLIGLDEL